MESRQPPLALSDEEIERAATKACRRLGYERLKEEQLRVVSNVIRQKDVFAVLPTGYGKSLCFACLPFVFDELIPLSSEMPSIVITVAPLTAIMKDQVANLQARGLSVCHISGDQKDGHVKQGVIIGRYQLVLFTPEMLLLHRRWRKMLLGDVYSKQLRVFVVDEAHTVKKWGNTFRVSLSRIGDICSLLPATVSTLALTATASKTLRFEVARMLAMKDEQVIALSPCKDNIAYAVAPFTTLEESFNPLVTRICKERKLFPKMIIYCRTFEECSSLYIFFRKKLGADFTEPVGAPDLPRFRLIDMYLSCTDKVVKDSIISNFTCPSHLRVVIATVAFGMGIDCPDVRQVIHLGPSSDIESYVQETGRAGRNGMQAMALLLRNAKTEKYGDKSMKEYVSNNTECRRDMLFGNFDGYSHVDDNAPCLCCDVCWANCSCGDCATNHQSFYFC